MSGIEKNTITTDIDTTALRQQQNSGIFEKTTTKTMIWVLWGLGSEGT